MTSFGFDVQNTNPSVAFDPLPPGWYAMRIIGAEIAPGKNPDTGPMARITFEIMDDRHPQFARRKVFVNLCHQHQTNEQTRNIARANIAAIMKAIGKPHGNTTDDMLGGELQVKLTVSPAKDGYDARNDARGFRGLDESVSEPAPAAAPAAKAGAPAPKAQPWKR